MSWIGLPMFLLLVSSVAQAGPFDPTSEQWQRAHVDIKFLKKYIRTIYPCYESPRGFLGCVELINSIGKSNQPPVQLVRSSQADANSMIHSFGDYALVPLTSTELTTRQEQQQRLDLLFSISSTWSGNKRPIDFLKLADQLLRTSTQSNARTIGEALNKLIAIHDFHGELIPTALNAGDQMPLTPELDTDGIGVVLNDDGDNTVFIQFVYKDSPAEKGGLQIGDEIVAVDSRPITNMDSGAATVVGLLLGRPGTSVTVEVRRPSGNHKTAKMKRAHFATPDAVERLVNDMGTPVLDIMISSFLDGSLCQYVQEDLAHYPNAKAIVLDLRGNIGGMEESARCVASLFVGKKSIYSLRTVDKNGKVTSPPRPMLGQRNISSRLPLAVLIDAETSSAAEILAGSLQDYGRAWIVGLRSYGKGSVQEMTFKNLSLLSMSTVAEYFLPSGRGLQAIGVKPDLIVDRSLSTSAAKPIREADFLPFALPPNNPNDVQNKLAAPIQNCLKAERAETLYKNNVESDSPTDLQLYKTEEMLNCVLQSYIH